MINPSEIPQIPGDMEALSGHARSLKSTGRSFASTGAQVHSTWQGLAPVYDAPEVGELLNATQPVSQISDAVGGHMETVGSALATYADTVKPIKAKLAALKSQAQTFVAGVEGDDEWREDEDKVNEHNKLLTDVNDAVAEWMEAQRTCANAINDLYGGTQYVADNGDGHRAGNEFGYSADQLDSALGGEEGLPWGTPEEHDGGLLGDVGDFFVGVKDGAVQMVTDLGALIGYSNGDWSWGTAGQAWKGLGTFALAAAVYGTPVVSSITAPLDQKYNDGKLGKTLVEAGKGIIAYDQWGKGHNGRAAGMATFNVVSAVVGTKGAGGALRGAGAGLRGAEAGAAATRVGSAMVRGGDFVAKMPTVSELGMKVATKLDMHIPRVNLGLAGDGPSFGHHVDTDIPATRGPDVAPTTHRSDGTGPTIGDGLRHGTDTTPHHGDGHTTHEPASSPHHDADGKPGEGTNPPHDPTDHGTPNDGHPSDGTHQPDQAPGDHTPNTGDHGDAGNGNGPDGPGTPGADGPLGNQPNGSWRGEEHGRTMQLDPQSNAAADRFLARAAHAESGISSQINGVVDRVDGAQMRGYPEFVLKSEESFKRKLSTELLARPDLTVHEALSGMKDSVRYTAEIPSSNYVHGVETAVRDLQARGFENVTFKPTWDSPGGYKGLNSTWRDPVSGQTFELQFHTPDSFNAKMQAHELYEAQRVPGVPESEIARLKDEQAEIFRQVERPHGAVDRLDDLKHQVDQSSPGNAVPHDPAPVHDQPDVAGSEAADPFDPADPFDGAPVEHAGDPSLLGATDVNTKPAIHSATATPEQAQRYIAENHPYVPDVNVERYHNRVPGSDQNCSRCVQAVDLGFTGTPASALPWPEGPGWGLTDNTYADYARSLGANPADFRKVSSYDEIIGDVAGRGEGARGMVYVSRPDLSAHVFNVVHDRHGVVFLDGQTGGLAHLEKGVDIMYLPIGG